MKKTLFKIKAGYYIKVLMAFYEENTFQGKGWIFDLVSTIHVCSHKKMFNSFVVKEEWAVIIVDGSAYEVIGTEIVKVTENMR